MIRVQELVIYPIKSLRGVSVERWAVEARGLRHDRRWMLVDEDGVFLTQRKLHRMSLVDVAIVDEGLSVDMVGHGSLEVPLRPEGSPRIVTVWNDECQALEVSAEANAWFSDALGVPCSLVYMPESTHRPLFSRDGAAEGPVGFADTNPVLVASKESIDDLNARLAMPIPIRRFRPNMVVSGCDPFEEDQWSGLSVGNARLTRSMRCARCLVPTIDIETAVPSDEPLRTLATFRKEGTHVWFGCYYAPTSLGEVAVGDIVDAS